MQVNTIANRTLISDQTNGKIKAKAPSAYLADTAVFPSGASDELLGPHFINDRTRALLEQAKETETDEEVADLYERFLQARESAMIEEIRKACGITPTKAEGPVEIDEPAADIEAGEALFEEPDDETEPAPAVQVRLNQAATEQSILRAATSHDWRLLQHTYRRLGAGENVASSVRDCVLIIQLCADCACQRRIPEPAPDGSRSC